MISLYITDFISKSNDKRSLARSMLQNMPEWGVMKRLSGTAV